MYSISNLQLAVAKAKTKSKAISNIGIYKFQYCCGHKITKNKRSKNIMSSISAQEGLAFELVPSESMAKIDQIISKI